MTSYSTCEMWLGSIPTKGESQRNEKFLASATVQLCICHKQGAEPPQATPSSFRPISDSYWDLAVSGHENSEGKSVTLFSLLWMSDFFHFLYLTQSNMTPLPKQYMPGLVNHRTKQKWKHALLQHKKGPAGSKAWTGTWSAFGIGLCCYLHAEHTYP